MCLRKDQESLRSADFSGTGFSKLDIQKSESVFKTGSGAIGEEQAAFVTYAYNLKPK